MLIAQWREYFFLNFALWRGQNYSLMVGLQLAQQQLVQSLSCFHRIKKCGSNSKTIAIVWRCKYCLKRKFWNNSFRTYINRRLIHEGDSNLPIIRVAGNLNIRRERSMSNQTRGRRLVLHFDGVNGYSGRDGQGSKCRFILLWYIWPAKDCVHYAWILEA